MFEPPQFFRSIFSKDRSRISCSKVHFWIPKAFYVNLNSKAPFSTFFLSGYSPWIIPFWSLDSKAWIINSELRPVKIVNTQSVTKKTKPQTVIVAECNKDGDCEFKKKKLRHLIAKSCECK